MSTKHQVHNLIILDESGSMRSIKSAIIEGFNEIVETVKGIEKQFPEQEHFISLVTFNGLGQKTLLWKEHVGKIDLIDGNTCWAFTYIGADHDVEKTAQSLSITNTITFQKNKAGTNIMFAKERVGRHIHSQRIRDNVDTDKNFYEDLDKT